MTIRTHTLGFPRVGLRRELKKAQESYWAGNATREELLAVGRELRARHWDQQKQAHPLARGHGRCGTGYRYPPIHRCSDDEPARCQAAGWWSEHGRTRRNRPPAAGLRPPVFADPSDARAARAPPIQYLPIIEV